MQSKRFNKLAIERTIVRSAQVHGDDLSEMIIVKKTIFMSALKMLTDEQLLKLASTQFLEAPLTDEMAFADWLYTQFVAATEMFGVRNQTEFGEKIHIKQGDVSKLINRPSEVSISVERKKQIVELCKDLFQTNDKRAS